MDDEEGGSCYGGLLRRPRIGRDRLVSDFTSDPLGGSGRTQDKYDTLGPVQ